MLDCRFTAVDHQRSRNRVRREVAGAARIASAGGRRRAGVPGSLGGRRRPAGRGHGAPAADPVDRRGPAAALLRPPVRRDDLQPVLLALPQHLRPGRRAVHRGRPPRPGRADRDDRHRDDRGGALRAHRRRRGGGRVQHRGRAPGPWTRLGVPRAHRGGRPRARHLALRGRRAAGQPQDAAGLLRRGLRRRPGASTTESSGCPSTSSPPRTRWPSPTPASTAPRPARSSCCCSRARWRSSAPAGPSTRWATWCCATCSTRASPVRCTWSTTVPTRSAGAPVVPERPGRAGPGRPGDRRGAGRRGRGGRRRLRRQGRARAGRDGDRLRRDRPRGRGAPAPAGRAGPGERHAGPRPELVRRHQHRPRRLAERLPLPAGPAARGAGLLLPVRRARGRPARQRRTPGARPVDVRLGGQPGRRQRQRPDAVLGGGRGHRGRDALPRVAGQPAQVQPDRPAARAAEAGGRREVRAVPRRCAGRPPGARVARPRSRGGRACSAGPV